MTATATADAVAPAIKFTAASRPMRRYAYENTVNILNGPASFPPIQLNATGWVRKISLEFTFVGAWGSAGAITNGDGPFRLISGISLSDAANNAIIQSLTGFNAYLINKYFPNGTTKTPGSPWFNPVMGPEYAYSATATTGTAVFRIDLDLEQDAKTGYGSVPNLDSNASLKLDINAGQYTQAFSATGASTATLSVRVAQWYWAPIDGAIGGVAVNNRPLGAGDYLRTLFETQTVSATTENTVTLTNKGGPTKGLLLISRAAGVRTAYTANSNVGVIYDNNAIDEGIQVDEIQDAMRREYGYVGTDMTGTSTFAALGAGTVSGIDVGVLALNFSALSPYTRDTWLVTRPGTLLQTKITPGAGATTLEVVTPIMSVAPENVGAFYSAS